MRSGKRYGIPLFPSPKLSYSSILQYLPPKLIEIEEANREKHTQVGSAERKLMGLMEKEGNGVQGKGERRKGNKEGTRRKLKR